VHPVPFRNAFERTPQGPRIVAVIPARFHSTRLPGKPLADVCGRPMIEHVYRRASEARGVEAVVVATDDERIAEAVTRFGGVARMTRSTHRTGTDRIAEVAADLTCDIIVNVQGDEPLLDARMLDELLSPFAGDESIEMTTLRHAITDRADYDNPNVVKVVVDRHGNALYFSRAAIPYFRLKAEATGVRAEATKNPLKGTRAFKHIGVYAYRRSLVMTLAGLPQTPLEIAESLEQLRALEHGVRIRTVETQFESIGVDTPEDLERVRRLLPLHRTGVRGGDPGLSVPAPA
jgi:3-deoxy-manno-octulosonate cytidylyltransferase (CMP-KDO synthetase)